MLKQSLTDTLKNKFWNDLQEIAKSLCKLHALQYNPNVESHISRWISYVSRLIEPKERLTKFSNNFWSRVPKKYLQAAHLLADKFEYGENVNPYQSRTIKSNNLTEKTSRRTDLLWADWNIHHFHLSTATSPESDGFYPRSDYLLFAIVRDDCVYFLDVKLHKKEDCFSNPLFIRQIVKSWPEIAESNRLKSITPDEELEAKKIHLYRKMGINVTTSLNGKVYAMGGGLSGISTPINDIYFQDKIFFEICALTKGLIVYCEKKKIPINQNNLSLTISNNELHLISSDKISFSTIKSPQLEQINHFFNQPWLLKSF
jgi:hypothetical protein